MLRLEILFRLLSVLCAIHTLAFATQLPSPSCPEIFKRYLLAETLAPHLRGIFRAKNLREFSLTPSIKEEGRLYVAVSTEDKASEGRAGEFIFQFETFSQLVVRKAFVNHPWRGKHGIGIEILSRIRRALPPEHELKFFSTNEETNNVLRKLLSTCPIPRFTDLTVWGTRSDWLYHQLTALIARAAWDHLPVWVRILSRSGYRNIRVSDDYDELGFYFIARPQ